MSIRREIIQAESVRLHGLIYKHGGMVVILSPVKFVMRKIVEDNKTF